MSRRLVPFRAFRLFSIAASHSTLAALGAMAALAMFALPRDASAAQLYGTKTVYYQSSDLAADQEARGLYRRIAEAAAMVCPPEDSRSRDETSASRACQRQAIARAVADIGNARLTAIFAHEIGRYR